LAKFISAPKLAPPGVFDTDLAQLVDEAGVLEKDLAAAKKLIKRYDEIRKIVQGQTQDAHAPGEEYEVHGIDSIMKFTAAADSRELTDKTALFKALGNDEFWNLAVFKMTELDKYLTPAEIASCVTVHENGGSRKCTVVHKEED
jgi:hypothetical protein